MSTVDPDSDWQPDQDELDFYESLARAAMADALPQANDAAIIDAAMAAMATVPVASRPARAGWVVAILALAAVGLLWVALPRGVVLRGAQGSWATEAGDTVATGDRIPAGIWLRVGDEACMAHGNAQLCALAGARVRVTDPDSRTLELSAGTVRVDAGTWRVQTAGEVHDLTQGDMFEAPREVFAEAAPAPRPKLQPLAELEPEPEPESSFEPAVEVETDPQPKRPSKPRADAATVLAEARKALGEQRVSDAVRLYEELLRRFPSSSEAKIGRISLAGLELDRGRAKVALRLYTAAAKGGGIAAEEAAWGRLRALHRLHRDEELRQAVEAFATKYPTSAYRARAQGLLE